MIDRYLVKEPSLPGITVNKDCGILLMNPAGSSCHEDTGREAQELADRGYLVIAADRPVSHSLWPDNALREMLRDSPIQAMDSLARKVDREADTLNLKHLHLVGRSAGATGVMELALTERISTAQSLYVAEPAACEDVPEKASTEYKTRLKAQSKLEKDDKKQAAGDSTKLQYIYPNRDYLSLPRWRQLYRYAANVALLLQDIRYNQEHLNQALVADYLGFIVLDLGIRTRIDFADKSMVLPANPAKRQAFLDRLERLHTTVPQHFGYGTVERTLHRSFDLRPFFFDRVEETMHGALAA